MLPPFQIVASLKSADMRGAFRELLRRVSEVFTSLPPEEIDELLVKLDDRESWSSTAFGKGVTVSHVYHNRFRQLVAAFGRSIDGIAYGPLGAGKVHAIFLLVVPNGRGDMQLSAVTKILRAAESEGFLDRVQVCKDEYEIHRLFSEIEGAGGNGSGQK